MQKLLVALFVALLMVGCGGRAQKEGVEGEEGGDGEARKGDSEGSDS